jgi:mycothiol synthase
VQPASRVRLEAAIGVVRAIEDSLLGQSRSDERDLSEWWRHADLERDSWAVQEDGRLLAFGWVEAHPEAASTAGFVHPEARGRGLGAGLVDRAETRAPRLGAERLNAWTYGADRAARALFESRGYREERRFWEMAIDLEDPPAEPEPPEGLRIETFREDDARAFHAAAGEAFAGEWGFAGMPFEEWWEMRRSGETYDPSLWFLVREGADVAAVCRCEAGRRGGGYVGLLGVRKPWRRRGLGVALLHHAFGEFYRRDERRVSLGVDSENPSGATRLYERAGMHIEVEHVVFRKQLS